MSRCIPWALSLLLLGTVTAADPAPAGAARVKSLKITVLSTMLADGRELGEWGFAALVEVDGHRIVSYGTSSYGYDIRCADEFKLFTNINSTIVDPKEFDEKNFVDIKGDSVIIPPNRFALARTV